MRPLLYAVAIVSSQFFLFLIMKLLLHDNTDIPPQDEDELAEDYFGLQSSEPVELNIVGLILARGGSKGIKKKNLMKIGNITLVGRSLRAIHEFGRFSSVWVSTDSVEIAGEAKAHGALIHWRSKESATDTASSILGVQDFLSHHTDINIIALIQCTSPFLTATFLTEAYDLMLQGDYDSVFSATRKFDLRWEENPDGTVKPLNFHPDKRPRRQDWGGELVENGMFYFAKVELIHIGLFQGGKTGVIEIPENHSLQVDTSFDLQMARAQSDAHLLL